MFVICVVSEGANFVVNSKRVFNFNCRWVLSKAKKDDTDAEVSKYDGKIFKYYTLCDLRFNSFRHILTKLH